MICVKKSKETAENLTYQSIKESRNLVYSTLWGCGKHDNHMATTEHLFGIAYKQLCFF